jgi:uncharacterized protein (TIGR02145 family)
MKTTRVALMFISIFFLACKSSPQEEEIGNQIWMTENLNIDHFRNGDPIPEARTAEEWIKAGENNQPAWCYYENRTVQDDPDNGTKYGKLYNWYAVNDRRGLAPKGWHIPTDDEWTILTNYLGGEDVAAKKLKSKTGWKENGNGSNKSGFNGLPSGYRHPTLEMPYNLGQSGLWWTTS